MFLRRHKPVSHVDEATEALKDATNTVKKVKDRDKEVQEVVNALRVLREQNHFAEQLLPSMVRVPRRRA